MIRRGWVNKEVSSFEVIIQDLDRERVTRNRFKVTNLHEEVEGGKWRSKWQVGNIRDVFIRWTYKKVSIVSLANEIL